MQMKTQITLLVGLAFGLANAVELRAEHKPYSIYSPSLKAKARKPDLFGNTRTDYYGKYGRKAGTSESRKPDLFGKTKTSFKDKYLSLIHISEPTRPY